MSPLPILHDLGPASAGSGDRATWPRAVFPADRRMVPYGTEHTTVLNTMHLLFSLWLFRSASVIMNGDLAAGMDDAITLRPDVSRGHQLLWSLHCPR
jgi:hypothetical protein